ncbi:MAG TPA: hypothetical protein VNQ14_11450 [Woeseiaceae bacterium]|nr:hypothetical protein [Woeseiaceae bacterium]
MNDSSNGLALVAGSFAAFLLAAAALVTGGSWLETPTVLFGIPTGNLLAWLMAFSLPLSAWLLLRNSPLRWPALLLVLMGALWLPASILLAGNVNLNYAEDLPFATWLIYCAFCLAIPLVLIAGWTAVRLLVRLRARFRSP